MFRVARAAASSGLLEIARFSAHCKRKRAISAIDASYCSPMTISASI